MITDANKHGWQVFLIILSAILILNALIFLPYINSLIIGLVLTVIFRPIHRYLLPYFSHNKFITAALTLLIAFIIVIIPISILIGLVSREVISLYQNIHLLNNFDFNNLLNSTSLPLLDYLPANFSLDLSQYVSTFLGWLAGNLGGFFSSAASVALNFVLVIFILFYLLKDTDKIKKEMTALSPLGTKIDQQIISRIERAIRSVVLGVLTIAVLQGLVTGLGLFLFGVPSPALWGGVAMVSALIPGIGVGLVTAPSILYLFFTIGWFPAFGFLLWALFAVGLIDNLLGPVIIGHGTNIHPLLLLLSVLGGLAFFGLIGFIAGPLSLALLVALLDIYKEHLAN